jgi:hypothetical protein
VGAGLPQVLAAARLLRGAPGFASLAWASRTRAQFEPIVTRARVPSASRSRSRARPIPRSVLVRRGHAEAPPFPTRERLRRPRPGPPARNSHDSRQRGRAETLAVRRVGRVGARIPRSARPRAAPSSISCLTTTRGRPRTRRCPGALGAIRGKMAVNTTALGWIKPASPLLIAGRDTGKCARFWPTQAVGGCSPPDAVVKGLLPAHFRLIINRVEMATPVQGTALLPDF